MEWWVTARLDWVERKRGEAREVPSGDNSFVSFPVKRSREMGQRLKGEVGPRSFLGWEKHVCMLTEIIQ